MNNLFLDAIRQYNMIDKGDTVAVCLSGGADSMALFHLMCVYRDMLDISVFAIHINHGLRSESAEEEKFITDYCHKQGVECVVGHFCMNDREKPQGHSTESWARQLRYEFFEKVAKEKGAKLATAHTLSDRCETVIFNLSRGTSLKGVCGIPAVRGNIIRPLINCTRQDVENYCDSNSIPFVTDESNLTDDYSRNKIRHRVVPVLKQLNSRTEHLIGEFTVEMEQIYTFLTQLSDTLYRNSVSLNGFDLDTIRKQDDVVIKFFLRGILEKNNCLSKENINDILQGIKQGSFSRQLNADTMCRVRDGYLTFYKPKPKIQPAADTVVPVEIGENTEFLSQTFCIRKISRGELEFLKKIDKNYLNNCIDCDTIAERVFFRSRKTGDTITLQNRNITKTVKKLFVEDKVPQRVRDKIAVLSDDAGNVIWLSGYGTNKRYAVTKDTQNILLAEKIQ